MRVGRSCNADQVVAVIESLVLELDMVIGRTAPVGPLDPLGHRHGPLLAVAPSLPLSKETSEMGRTRSLDAVLLIVRVATSTILALARVTPTTLQQFTLVWS